MEVTDKTRTGGLTGGARLTIFVNVVLICVLATLLAFATIWLVGRIAWKHDLRLDLTRDDRFTVDPLAASVIKGLSGPVHATFVYGIDDEIRSRALDLARRPREDVLLEYYRPLIVESAGPVSVVLREWSKLSELFTFDVVDADAEPQRLAELAQRTGRTPAELLAEINQVVFRMGPRRRTVPMGRMFPIDWGFISPDPRQYSKLPERIGKARVQSELTEALRGLAAGETLRVGVPQGIAPAIPYEGPEWESLKEFLTTQGFEPVPFDLARGVPDDFAMVMVLGMGRKLLPEEARVLEGYEKAGGRVLLFANLGKPESFQGLLAPFGVTLEAARVEDPKRMAPGQANQYVLLSNELVTGNHEIVRPIGDKVGIWVGATRPLKIEDLKAEGAERIVLLKASPQATAVPIEYREQSGEPDFVVAAKRSARDVPIAAALRRPAASGKESRIVVFGSWEVASPWAVGRGTHFGNRDLLLNALNWLADRKTAIGVVEREIAASRVEITPGFLSGFRWITMAALPALVLLGALFMWLSRRN